MPVTARSLALGLALAVVAALLVETLAFAQCPPGTRWSNRAWRCVRVAPPPPPPGYYVPPPRPGRGSCNRSYQNCLYVCAGVPACINNCNVGYSVCVGGS